MNHLLRGSLAAMFLAVLPPLAAQSVPLAISYQAALNGDDGPLGQGSPTNYPVKFRIFDALENGSLLWSEGQTISVFEGSFSTLLGTGDEIPGDFPGGDRPRLDEVFDDRLRYLEITVADGAEKTFSPRQRMVSAPFAFRASVANKVIEGGIPAASLANNSVETGKIQAGAVTTAKIAGSAVGAAQIADNSVTSADIQNGSIDLDDLATRIANRLVPAGTVVAWAGTDVNRTQDGGIYRTGGVPAGWLLCAGGAFNKNSYPALFAAISYIYGGSGNSPGLPDYRGYFLRGQGNTSLDTQWASRVKSSGGFSVRNNLYEGSIQQDAFKSHRHDIAHSGDGAGQSAGVTYTGVRGTTSNVNTQAMIKATGNTYETRPKNRYVWYIIKAH